MIVNLMLHLSSTAAVSYIKHRILLNILYFLINMIRGNLLPVSLSSVLKSKRAHGHLSTLSLCLW